MKQIKCILFLLLSIGGVNYGQTTEQIKKAKDFIQRSGMSPQQVRDEAKARGYSDKQIDEVIEEHNGWPLEGSDEFDIPPDREPGQTGLGDF